MYEVQKTEGRMMVVSKTMPTNTYYHKLNTSMYPSLKNYMFLVDTHIHTQKFKLSYNVSHPFSMK